MDLGLYRYLCRRASHLPRALLLGEEVIHLLHNAAASPSPLPTPHRLPTAHFRSTIALTVGVLSAVLSLAFLIFIYAKHGLWRRSAGGGDDYSIQRGAGYKRPNPGVDRAVVESLPVFPFGRREEGLDCAVCLRRFMTPELLRLLPKCRHAFHIGCVDTWLAAHTTCPLCRRKVDPEDVFLALGEPPAGPKPHSADVEGVTPLHWRLCKSEEFVRVVTDGIRARLHTSTMKKLRRKSADDALLGRSFAPPELEDAGAESSEMGFLYSAWHGGVSLCSSPSAFASGDGVRGAEQGVVQRWLGFAAHALRCGEEDLHGSLDGYVEDAYTL